MVWGERFLVISLVFSNLVWGEKEEFVVVDRSQGHTTTFPMRVEQIDMENAGDDVIVVEAYIGQQFQHMAFKLFDGGLAGATGLKPYTHACVLYNAGNAECAQFVRHAALNQV